MSIRDDLIVIERDVKSIITSLDVNTEAFFAESLIYNDIHDYLDNIWLSPGLISKFVIFETNIKTNDSRTTLTHATVTLTVWFSDADYNFVWECPLTTDDGFDRYDRAMSII